MTLFLSGRFVVENSNFMSCNKTSNASHVTTKFNEIMQILEVYMTTVFDKDTQSMTYYKKTL